MINSRKKNITTGKLQLRRKYEYYKGKEKYFEREIRINENTKKDCSKGERVTGY